MLGGWQEKCRYDKAGLSCHYGPSVGLIVLPWDGLVRRPYVPGPCAWPMEGFLIGGVAREHDVSMLISFVCFGSF